MGESAAREARYANDGGFLRDDDTVLNVVDRSAITEQLVAFSVGAADQVLEARRTSDGERHRVRSRDRPPFVTLSP